MDLLTRLPGLSGDVNQDIRKVFDYTFQFSEEIRFWLNNLEISDFNAAEWAKYEDGLVAMAAERMEVRLGELEVLFTEADAALEETLGKRMTEISASVSGLRVEVSEEITALGDDLTDLGTEVAGLESGLDDLDTKVGKNYTTLSAAISVEANRISNIVSGVGSNGTVTAASIVAAINRAGSSVQISADHVDISGVVTFDNLTDGETIISGDNLQTGSIQSMDIYGGTITGATIQSTGPEWGDIVISNGTIEIGTAQLYDDGWGNLYINESAIHLTAGGGLHAHCESDWTGEGGGLFVYCGSAGSYWEFTSGGILWKDASGNVINRVLLAG